MKRITISIRDYVFDQIFPLDKDLSDINKSARIEELISKGLDSEKKKLYENESKE